MVVRLIRASDDLLFRMIAVEHFAGKVAKASQGLETPLHPGCRARLLLRRAGWIK